MTTNETKRRNFLVATLRTQGPCNKIRGEFLLEVVNDDWSRARIWNRSKKQWLRRRVNVECTVQVAGVRAALMGDLARFGIKYTGPIC